MALATIVSTESSMMKKSLDTPKEETINDQWQSQIFVRVPQRAGVMFISSVNNRIVTDLHMIPAHSLPEAVTVAEKMVGNPEAMVTAISEGVAVIVKI